MKDRQIELLEEIDKSLKELNVRENIREEMSDSNKTLQKIDNRVEYSTNQIQNSFDRIHDKVFNFNNIILGAFLVLSTYPSNSPIINMWLIIFPIAILIFLVWLEIRQMGIHRLAAKENEWTSKELKEYGDRINKQTLLSLLSFVLSISSLLYLIYKIVQY